jgi:drug/metabolite transporter (DMT)-like permease
VPPTHAEAVVVPLTLALGASVAWGASDFLGGLATRHLPLVAVLFGAQAVGLALAAGAWLLAGGTLPTGTVLVLAAGAGLAELVGFALLYRGLAVGEMSLVAPLAALTALLPIVVALSSGERIAATQACGIALALVGTVLAASEPGHRRLARGAGLGLAAAVAFGAFLVGLGAASEHAGTGAVLVGRLASVGALAALLCVRRPAVAPTRMDVGNLAALGALDVLANLAYARAAVGGSHAVIAVLASLYPLTTVLLARTLLHERLGRARAGGVASVLLGVALLSAGQL